MDITVSSDIDSEYLSLIQNILDDPEFKKLGLYTQHLKTTRLMHSINVSYISWMIARKFGLDECAAARAGLLHDFFLYYAIRWGFGPAKVYRLAVYAFRGHYEPDFILKWLENFYRRFFAQQFKRSCLPDGPKVGTVTLSPRGDWRMPSDAVASLWMNEVEKLKQEK